ncbi:MAG TPA: peptidylprolyl isomerase [Candidatus Sulfotelmatobacter sp.]|nr:peptidylprolyl isomerase [Candidatus Sulfotelmatobacter sp.]
MMHRAKWCLFIAGLVTGTTVAQTTPPSQVEPEQICLSEILIRLGLPGPTRAAEKHLADEVRKTIKLGGAFADLASANSQGPPAAQGGALGCLKRGQLAKPLEEQVFRMKSAKYLTC